MTAPRLARRKVYWQTIRKRLARICFIFSVNHLSDQRRHTGQPYVVPRGRYAPRGRVEDRLRLSHAVVDLDGERPMPGEFIARILREMKIRFYGQKSVKNYRTVLSGFLRWFGHRPDLITREDEGQGTPSADVVLHILTEPRAIRLSGIVVREPRPGWVTLEVPPLEEWREPLKWLTREERERVESPSFYRTLQEHLTQRYLSACRA